MAPPEFVKGRSAIEDWKAGAVKRQGHMTPYITYLLETGGVLALAIAGATAGRGFSRLRKPYWTFGYFVPLLLLVLIEVPRSIPVLEFSGPFRWLTTGRRECALMAAICTCLLTTPLSRLPGKGQKRAVIVFAAVLVIRYSVFPFFLPALTHSFFTNLDTRMDAQGICRQSTDYTCGPAAAVTALRSLDIPAEEGELAILAHASFATGTSPDSLITAIRKRHRLVCTLSRFGNVSDLRGREPVIVVVKHSLLADHYITVLEVTDSKVVVGDPILGRKEMAYAELSAMWRNCGIVIPRVIGVNP